MFVVVEGTALIGCAVETPCKTENEHYVPKFPGSGSQGGRGLPKTPPLIPWKGELVCMTWSGAQWKNKPNESWVPDFRLFRFSADNSDFKEIWLGLFVPGVPSRNKREQKRAAREITKEELVRKITQFIHVEKRTRKDKIEELTAEVSDVVDKMLADSFTEERVQRFRGVQPGLQAGSRLARVLAFCVGIDDYSPPTGSLRNCCNDARLFCGALATGPAGAGATRDGSRGHHAQGAPPGPQRLCRDPRELKQPGPPDLVPAGNGRRVAADE